MGPGESKPPIWDRWWPYVVGLVVCGTACVVVGLVIDR